MSNPPQSPGAEEEPGGFLVTLAHRPRLLAGALIMVATYLVSLFAPVVIRESTRLLIAWNVGDWAYLVLIMLFFRRPDADPKVDARPEDESQWVLVVLGVIAACASLAAIVWELGPVKTMDGPAKAAHLALVVASILSAWTFIQVMFAIHYAGVYFGAVGRRRPGRPRVPRQSGTRLDRVRLSGVHRRLHLRQFRHQRDLDPDAAHLRHPGRRRVLLQHHRPRPRHQHRGRVFLTLSRRPDRTPMTESSPSNRVRAALPRGLVDRAPADIAAAEAMMAKIRSVYALYGFEAVETPFIEYTEALGKFLPDQDRPNEGVFSFKDDDEQWLSLRYDLTAPLARYVAENYDRLPKPYRSYRAGWVFRNEKPGPGRYRQFMQFDADTVGAASVAADAEICMMAADCLEALGIQRGDYVIKVNNRKVLDGRDGGDRARRRRKCRTAADRAARDRQVRPARRRKACARCSAPGARTRAATLPGSGARSPGCRTLGRDKIAHVLEFIRPGSATVKPGPSCGGRQRQLTTARRNSAIGEEGHAFVDNIGPCELGIFYGATSVGEESNNVSVSSCEAAGYGPDRIRVDPSVVRGLEYYTGPVFEAELTFETTAKTASRSGSARSAAAGATTASSRASAPSPCRRPASRSACRGCSRRCAPSTARSSRRPRRPGRWWCWRSTATRRRWPAPSASSRALRAAGIAAEMYLGQAGMNAQLKYADKRMSRVAVIQGSNERDAPGGPLVAIRDLKLGAELAKSTKDRADYLELRQRAQFTAPEAELVERVREVLARG